MVVITGAVVLRISRSANGLNLASSPYIGEHDKMLHSMLASTITQGLGLGTAAAVAATTTNSEVPKSIAGAVGTAAAVGAITAALKCGSYEQAIPGAYWSSLTAYGVATLGTSSADIATKGFSLAELGNICLGAQERESNLEGKHNITFDYWKPVLHEESEQPSKGMLLGEVCADNRIKECYINDYVDSPYPNLILKNIWNEEFEIVYLILPCGELAAHAVPLSVNS